MTAISEPAYRSRASSLALRYALRELRSGLRGFYVFIACIALGVMAIAGVGSVAASLSEGLTREGRTLLGGDVAFSLIQREAKPEELAFLRARGQVSVAAALRGHGPRQRRQAGAGRAQGRGRQLSDARPGDARAENADGGSAGRAPRYIWYRVRRRGRFHPAGAARSQARRPHRHRQRHVPDPQRGHSRAGQARRQCRAGPARSGQRSKPARHRVVAARQPGALDLPCKAAGQRGRRSRRELS